MARLAAHREEPGTSELDHWLQVFETEFDYVYRALWHFGAARADIEDLAQEVLLAMWRRRHHYDPERPLRPWIAGIAFRVVQESRRRSGRERPVGLPDVLDEVPGQEEQLERAQTRRLVRLVLARLPENQRAAVVMHHLDGMTVREIAEALSLPLFTVYSQLKRGLSAFAREIRRDEVITSLPPALRALTPGSLLVRGGPADDRPARKRSLRRLSLLLLGSAQPRDPRAASPGPGAPGAWQRSSHIGWRLPLAALLAGALTIGLASALVPPPPEGRAASEPARPRPTVRIPATAPAPVLPVPPLRGEMAPALAAAGATAWAAPPTRGRVGYWRFDEGRGPHAADQAEGGNHCSLRNLDPVTAWGAGVLGGALAFTGKGWLECPVTGALAGLDQQMTIGLWVTRGHNLKNYRSLVSRQLDWGRQDEFMFGFANGELVFASHAWRGRVVNRLPAGLGRWFHVAVTRDRDGTTILYADGVEIGRGSSEPAPLPRGGNPLIIGAAVNGEDPSRTEFRFDGAIDELAIYDRPLLPAELSALAQRTPTAL
jgi:RNA polymerase sigma-70 factor, ECF subfamily